LTASGKIIALSEEKRSSQIADCSFDVYFEDCSDSVTATFQMITPKAILFQTSAML
jgi:hypothetical protein